MPIRVLHFICSTGFYGAERWILALANNSDRTQITSELAVTREHATHDLELSKSFKAIDLPVHELEMNGRFDVRVMARLSQIVKSRNIDIIHTHGYKSDILGMLVAKRTGIVSVCTPHGFENGADWKLRLYTWIGGRSFRYFDCVVPLSKQLYSDVLAYGVPKSRVRLITNGVDLKPIQELLCRRSKDNLPLVSEESRRSSVGSVEPVESQKRDGTSDGSSDRRTLTVGYIGQLIERKNVKHVLNIFEAIAGKHRQIQLKILGDGDARVELEAYATQLNASSRISFLGFVNEPLEFLADFDLFVMTSSLEGIPRCLMEAMAMNVPVAAYRIAGVDQLIIHNKTGMLAEFGDQKSLQDLWESLLFDEELALRVSSNAKRFIEETYSAQRMASEYTQLYKELLTTGIT